MLLHNKKILITGADGFIGSHLTEELCRRGHDVRAFVCYNSFNSWGWLDHAESEVKKSLEVVSGDIRDPYGVRAAVKGCEAVLHLAALIAIPYSYRSPDSYIDTNIRGTLNVLQASREHEVTKVVHTSTSEVYGTARYVPIDEEHPLQGQSPYSASKIGADHLAHSFFCSFNTPVAIIRPFDTYGPRQSARAVIPTIVTQLLNGNSRVELGALTPTRDFNYIKDTVSGFIAVAESDASVGEVINIGSGHEISIGETVELIAEIMGLKVKVVCGEHRVRPNGSEVTRLCAANGKAKQLLEWAPAYSGRDGLRAGLSETIAWFRDAENLGLYKSTYTI